MTDLIEASMSALAERYTPPVVRIIKPVVANENYMYWENVNVQE